MESKLMAKCLSIKLSSREEEEQERGVAEGEGKNLVNGCSGREVIGEAGRNCNSPTACYFCWSGDHWK